MTPGARIAAAIGLIDAFLAGSDPMDRMLTRWGRENRYAGSGDRRAIADLVYDGLRRLRSASWAGGEREPSGRAAMIGLLRQAGRDPATLFDGKGHSPEPLTAEEADARLPDPPAPVALDYPDWMDDLLRTSLGADMAPVMAAMQERAPVWLRVNTLKASPADAIDVLSEDGVSAEPAGDERAPAALLVSEGARRVAASRAFAEGLVEVQDLSSQVVATMAGASPGEVVLDFCAGGGGKTLALGAEMQGQGRLLVHDADERRLADLWRRAERAGLNPERGDPVSLAGACDLVFADAPCSGSGAWRRNPDARWRLTAERLAKLTALQDEVLDQAAACVRPGGRLVYATCSMLNCENAERIAAFLARQPDFTAGAETVLRPPEPGDGFYFRCLARR